MSFLLLCVSNNAACKNDSSENDYSLRLVGRVFLCGTVSDLKQNNTSVSLKGESLFSLTIMRSPIGGFIIWSIYNKGQVFSFNLSGFKFHGVITDRIIVGRFVLRAGLAGVVTYTMLLIVV